jgi:hypothetical protein
MRALRLESLSFCEVEDGLGVNLFFQCNNELLLVIIDHLLVSDKKEMATPFDLQWK